MNAAYYPVIAFGLPILPVVAAVLLFVPGLTRPMLRLAPWLPLTAAGLLMLQGQVVELPWLLLGARIGLDATALPLFTLAIVAWTLAGLHAAASLGNERRTGFFFFWLMAWTGNLCVFITLDAASFYAAYGTLTFAAYGLVVHWMRPEDFRAGRVYLIMAMIGEGLIIAALLVLGSEFGNIPLEQGGQWVAQLPEGKWVAVLFALGFGIKMGVVPLHMWLPLAHPQAPVPASAVLSGVIVKAGLMGWLRFLPAGFDTGEFAGLLLLVAGILTTFYGVVVGLSQQRVKAVLAYSTISQMGLIAILIGLSLLHPNKAGLLTMIAGLFALHHGLAKSALFLSVDLVKSAPGLARGIMWLPAVAIAGAPLTSGALAKTLMKTGIPEAQYGWLDPLLMIGSGATTLIMARFLVMAWPPRKPGHSGPWLPYLILIGLVAALPWLYALLIDPAWVARPFRPEYLAATASPVLSAAILAFLAARLLHREHFPSLPEGDLICLFPRISLPSRPVTIKHARTDVRQWRILDRAEACFAELALAVLVWLVILALIFLPVIATAA